MIEHLRIFGDEFAEKLLLGCALRDLETARKVVAHAREQDFHHRPSQLIFAVLREAVKVDPGPIFEAVRHRLYVQDQLEEVGGVTGLLDLVADSPTSLYWPNALDSCRQDAYRRQFAVKIAGLVAKYEEGESPAALQRELADALESLAPWVPGFVAESTIERLVARLREARARRIRGESAPLTWGLCRLDRRIELRRGGLYVVVGDTSHLKSALLLHAAAAMMRDHRLLVVPLEEHPENWLVKLACRVSGVPMSKAFRPETMTKQEIQLLEEAEDAIQASRNVVLPDLAGVRSVDDLAAPVDAYEPAVLMLDYLQLFPSRPRARTSTEEELSWLGKELQRLATTSGVCIVAVSSVNRAGASLEGRPSLQSIRGSHGLAHSPHGILGTFYPHKADPAKHRSDVVQLAILKEKTGTTGPYSDFFVDPATCRFFDDENKVLLEDRPPKYEQARLVSATETENEEPPF